ncbi:MAG: SDR family NAD(P)-dependent oxidoreductase [Candidatus Puniceispirillaceae bacterium]
MSTGSDKFNVAGRVACITGASGGLGRRCADALAAAGAAVVGVARREDMLAQWAASGAGKRAYVAADLMDEAGLDALCDKLVMPFGAPDIIVHAVGVNLRQPADEVTAEGWQQTLWLNLTVPFLLSQRLLPHIKARGWGRIVNFASLQSARAFPGGIAYGASKGGVAQMTRAMAEAWSADGINTNAIGPGFFPTELTAAVFADDARAERNAAQTCIGRNGRLEDIDGPLLILCSPAADYVTGQILMVDGGFTAK